MNERQEFPGAQFQGDRPREQDAVRTTIVGGRPPGSGQSLSGIPRGLEVLLKKASVDPEFKTLLLTRRVEAAQAIGLALEPSEVLMLQSAPASQLEAVIGQVRVPQEHRRTFLGQAAAAMLAALGVGSLTSGCEASDRLLPAPGGIAPKPPPPPSPPSPEKIEQHVKELLAKRFQTDLDKLTGETSLVEGLKATDTQLAGLKRQLEREYTIKLPSPDFFDKVKTVGELIKAVQTAVKNRPEPKPGENPESPIRGIRPDNPSRGTRPDRASFGVTPE
jgi:acyl carrier protein